MSMQDIAEQHRQANRTFLVIGLTLVAGVVLSFWCCVS